MEDAALMVPDDPMAGRLYGLVKEFSDGPWARPNFVTLGLTWDLGNGFLFDCDLTNPGLTG